MKVKFENNEFTEITRIAEFLANPPWHKEQKIVSPAADLTSQSVHPILFTVTNGTVVVAPKLLPVIYYQSKKCTIK